MNRAFFAIGALLLLGGIADRGLAQTSPTTPMDGAYRLRVVRDGRTEDATCVLVQRELRGPDVVLHFVTAAHVLTAERSVPSSLTVVMEDGFTLNVRPEDVVMPTQEAPDVAVFTAIAPETLRTFPLLTTDVPARRATFEFVQKTIPGPMLSVACGEEQSGDLEVPFVLSPGEKAVDASVSFLNRTSLRLADVSVLHLADRSVKLRFTLEGQPPPQFSPPDPCPRGEALVNVRIDVVSVRR